MSRYMIKSICLMVCLPLLSGFAKGKQISRANELTATAFVQLLDPYKDIEAPLAAIEKSWRLGYAPALLEVIRFQRSAKRAAKIYQLLQTKTGQKLPNDFSAWSVWLWNQSYKPFADYPTFKALLYGQIDPKFFTYFHKDRSSNIRLDEVVWGGVRQDGIPPLRKPKMILAQEATYLNDADIVFGVAINGDVRAYPKRILAWHEMFVDTVGNVDVAGVYCTLCGSAILYETEHKGTKHEIGTSGFLYRSNKLMYDKATQSLWNTLWGTPEVGPLVGKGIELTRRSIVTTTWKRWKTLHPKTKVLSLKTGHKRDYGEGVAYRDYFASDRLMFEVPALDTRLKNKEEVLALRFSKKRDESLAIPVALLRKKPVFMQRLSGVDFVILTDQSGAARVYEAKGKTFETFDAQENRVKDKSGTWWKVEESKLTAKGGTTLKRLPSHNAFWFGWKAAYPKTKLIQK